MTAILKQYSFTRLVVGALSVLILAFASTTTLADWDSQWNTNGYSDVWETTVYGYNGGGGGAYDWVEYSSYSDYNDGSYHHYDNAGAGSGGASDDDDEEIEEHTVYGENVTCNGYGCFQLDPWDVHGLFAQPLTHTATIRAEREEKDKKAREKAACEADGGTYTEKYIIDRVSITPPGTCVPPLPPLVCKMGVAVGAYAARTPLKEICRRTTGYLCAVGALLADAFCDDDFAEMGAM